MVQSSELVLPAERNALRGRTEFSESDTLSDRVIQNVLSTPKDTQSGDTTDPEASPGKSVTSIPEKSWRLNYRNGIGTGFSMSYKRGRIEMPTAQQIAAAQVPTGLKNIALGFALAIFLITYVLVVWGLIAVIVHFS